MPVRFRFYGELNDFLPAAQKQQAIFMHFPQNNSVKDAIESLGIPHTEIALILVNGESTGFNRRIGSDDSIAVYPTFRKLRIEAMKHYRLPPDHPIRFVLDVHLGKLARFLRYAGFDTVYENFCDDDRLAEIAASENRVLLSRDIALLKRKKILYGCFVRSTKPSDQFREILESYYKHGMNTEPRCPKCNGILEYINKTEIAGKLPPMVRKNHDEFTCCQFCGQVYWEGSHYRRLSKLFLEAVKNIPAECKPLQDQQA